MNRVPAFYSLLCAFAFGIGAQSMATAPASALPQLERVMLNTNATVMPDFTLTRHDGKPMQFSELRGRPVLVFFGFTNCPDVCPAAMGKLKMLRETGGEELRDVQIVMISVDGERDTPEVMKHYLAAFPSDFIGLTGAPADVRRIANRFSAPFFKGQPRENGAYLIQHSSQVFVLDRQGRLRAEFYDASVEVMRDIARILVAESA